MDIFGPFISEYLASFGEVERDGMWTEHGKSLASLCPIFSINL